MTAESETGTIPKRVLFQKRWSALRSHPLQEFAEQLSGQVADGRDFACMLTTAEELARLNGEFRGKNYSTDVLSFPSQPQDRYLGDIAISVPHARNYSKEYGHSLEDEIRVLMLHGILHLIGMDHETDEGAMKKAERRWRKKLGLPAGLIQRSQ